MTEQTKNCNRCFKKPHPCTASIICALIAGIASYISSCQHSRTEMAKLKEEFHLELKRSQHENRYQIKQDAIIRALSLLDIYYSWQNLSEIVPARKKTTVTDLTEQARDCYNRLCVTCDNATLLNAFLDCIFGNPKDGEIPLELYNKFRNEARKELCLESLPLSPERIFLSVVSPEALSSESLRQADTSQKAPNHP